MELAFELTKLALRGIMNVIFYIPDALHVASKKIFRSSKKIPS